MASSSSYRPYENVDTVPIVIETELPPLQSDAGDDTWDDYEELIGQRQDREQIDSSNVVSVVYDFGGTKELVPSTYQAAYLIKLVEALSASDSSKAAAAYVVLERYKAKGQDQQDRKYVRAVAGDMVEINRFIDQHRNAQGNEPQAPTPDPTLDGVEFQETDGKVGAMERQYQNPWQVRNEKIPVIDMLELVSDEPDELVKDPKGVNIESILLAASSAYMNLRNSGKLSEDELLRTVYAVESFFENIVHIIGYDGFASALKREADLVRLSRNNGVWGELTVEKLEIARDFLRQLPAADEYPRFVDNILAELFPNKFPKTQNVLHDTSGHGMKFGAGVLEEDDNADIDEVDQDIDDANILTESDPRIAFREKSDTEFAKKILIRKIVDEQGHETVEYILPADIIGLTVIIPSFEEISELYNGARKKIKKSKRLEFTHSRSRTTPFHAKGLDMIRALTRASDTATKPIALEKLDRKEDSANGHEVAKITFKVRLPNSDLEVPIEMQFQTPQGRRNARVGAAAHFGKTDSTNKDEKYPELEQTTIQATPRLNQRRTMTSEPGLTAQSIKRADELFSRKTRKAMGAASRGLRFFIESDQGATIDV